MLSKIYFEQVPIDIVKKILSREESQVKEPGPNRPVTVRSAERNQPDVKDRS